MMNCVNPLAMISWAVQEAHPDLAYVGLCHSVQETSGHLARILGEDIRNIDYRSAGINHVAFFTKFHKRLPDGSHEDLYPRLRAIAESGKAPEGDKVRFEVLKHFGHFVTESSEHFSEYTPWFIKDGRTDLIDTFQVPLDDYIRRCEEQIAEWGVLKHDLEDEARRLHAKLEAGAHFVMTQPIFDVDVWTKFLKVFGEPSLPVPVMVGILPLLAVAGADEE
jgi:alpha-galactosidase